MEWLNFIAHKYPGWTLFLLFVILYVLANSIRSWFQFSEGHRDRTPSIDNEDEDKEEEMIKDTCPCGSNITIDTDWDSTAKGVYSDWLNAHEVCRKAWAANLNEAQVRDVGAKKVNVTKTPTDIK